MTYSTKQIEQVLRCSPHTALALFQVGLLTDVHTTKPGGTRHAHAAEEKQVKQLARHYKGGSLTAAMVKTLRYALELEAAPKPEPRRRAAVAAPPSAGELVLTPAPVLAGPSTTAMRAWARVEGRFDRVDTRLTSIDQRLERLEQRASGARR